MLITSLDKDYPIIDELIEELNIKKVPDVSSNVMAGFIDSKHILYLNTGSEPKLINL